MFSQGSKEILGSAYAAAKGGVIALTNALAVELAPHIRVNCIVPGAVQSSTYELMQHFAVDGTDLVGAAVTHSPSDWKENELDVAHLRHEKTGVVNPRAAKVEQVAEAILAVSDPRSDWVTGEKILIGD